MGNYARGGKSEGKEEDTYEAEARVGVEGVELELVLHLELPERAHTLHVPTLLLL